jgi:hypothetical protein
MKQKPEATDQPLPDFVRMDGGDATLVISLGGPEPAVIYWGVQLAPGANLRDIAQASRRTVPPNALATEPPISLSPSIASGFSGQPGLSVHASGAAWCPMFVIRRVDWVSPSHLAIVSHDPGNGLSLIHHFSMEASSGVLALWSEVRCDEGRNGLFVDHLRRASHSARWPGKQRHDI